MANRRLIAPQGYVHTSTYNIMEPQDIPQTPSTPIQILSDLHLEINQQYPSFENPHLRKISHSSRRRRPPNRLRPTTSTSSKNTHPDSNSYSLLWATMNSTICLSQKTWKSAKQLEQEPSLQGRLVLLHRRGYLIPRIRG